MKRIETTGREANATGNNEKPFGDTRQFDVPKNPSGDTLRARINQANEQILREKRNQSSASAAAGNTAKTVRRTGNAAGTAHPQNTVKPAQDPTVRTNAAAHPQSAHQPVQHAVAGHTMQQHTAAKHPVAQTGQSVAAQQGTNVQQPTAVSRPRTNPVPAERQIPQNAHPVNVRPQTQPQTPDPQAKATARRTGKVAEKSGLQKTRVTDISALTGHTKRSARQGKEQENTEKDKRKRREKEEVVSDEGGNTVVSVVKAVIYMIFVVVTSIFLAVAVIMVGNDVFAFVKTDSAIPVTIPEYATLNDVIDILYQNGVIEYPKVFRLYAQLKKDNGKFVAGDYTVSPVMNYDELLDEFKEKPKLGTVRITFPEGYTTDEIIDLMVSYGIGTREGYEDVIQNYDFDYWFIDELEEGGVSKDRFYRLDGYLFPDTYDFYNASSEATVINKMLRRFDQLFTDEHRRLCKEMGYSVDEILTIASLIEKEAGSAAEFFNVSSVFHNRLKAKSYFPRLESDATIVYAIQHETGERPQLKDTNYDSPYNTYLHEGLPPGPIANPSASAILAALSPAKTNYYYFVSDGSKTYFSETKEQHNQYIEAIKNNTISQSYIPETDEVQ